MTSLIVTLHSPSPRGTLDLELPGEVPLRNLLPELVRVLQLPPADGAGRPITYQLVHQAQRRPLREAETLLGAGIVTGDVLSLVGTAPQMHTAPGGASGGRWGASALHFDWAQYKRQGSGQALLRCASGMVIALDNYGKPELTVGRYDARTGKAPDIDLSEEPASNTVSRSHALLRKQGPQWVLVPLSTRNPTRVGKTRLAPQQPRPLKQGDVITLGGVRLVFEVGRSP